MPRQAVAQRGAVGIAAAVLLFAALVMLVLAVDTGRLFVEQRDLQRIADTAALETALGHTGCETDAAAAVATAQASAARNGYAGDLAAEPDAVLLGRLAVVDGLRVFEASGDAQPQAVRIRARSEVPTSLVLGGLFGNTTTLAAEAVARRTPLAGLAAGSRAAGLDSADAELLNALLNGLLGSELALDAVSWRGLAATSVSLLELGEGLGLVGAGVGAGTVDELLRADVALVDVLEVAVAVVEREAPAEVNASVLRHQLLGSGIAAGDLALGEFLKVAAPGDPAAALEAGVNVLDLILVSALTATGDHAVEVDAEGLLPTLPGGVVNADSGIRLRVIESPQIAIGPPGRDADGEWHTRVETAQLRLQLDVDLDLALLGQSVRVDLGVALAAADGEAWLEALGCPEGRDVARELRVGVQPGIATLRLGRFADIEAPGAVDFEPGRLEVGLLGGAVTLAADLGAEVPLAPGAPETLYFEIHDRSDLPSVAQSVSSGTGDALAHAVTGLEEELILALELDVAGLEIGVIGDGLVGSLVRELLAGVLAPLLEAMGDQVLDPLIGLLGASVGGVEVQIVELREGGAYVVR